MSRLTVFHLDGERTLRGGERQVLLLAAGLRSRGHENVLVCRKDGPLDLEAEKQGFRRLHLPFLTEYDPLSAWRLRGAALAEARPLLHAHTGHTGALAGLAAAMGGLPRVTHRRVAFPPTGGLDFTLKYRQADRVIALSTHIKRLLVEAGLPASQVSVVPSCVPPAKDSTPEEALAFRRRLGSELGLDPSALWLGTLAALTDEKGHASLLEAYALLKATQPSACLLLAGEGPLLEPLRALARRLGIEKGLRFLGQRSDPERVLEALDVYVQPSLSEGLGGSVLQAMSKGLPVAASRTGGLTELVREGQTGLLFEPGRPGGIAQALNSLCASPELRKAYGTRAKAAALAYTPEAMAQATEQVYMDVLKGAPIAA